MAVPSRRSAARRVRNSRQRRRASIALRSFCLSCQGLLVKHPGSFRIRFTFVKSASLFAIKTKAVILTVRIWFALTIAFGAIGIVTLNWPEALALATRAVEVQGTVVSKEPENHKFIQYTYVVGEATYSGLGSAGRDNPTFEQLKIGDRVKLYYDPDSPKESILGDPKEHAKSITRGWLPISKGRI